MPAPLMKSVSGIRGIVGESLTPDIIVRTASALARYTKRGTIVIGRDTRPTGVPIARGIESALLLAGCDVIDIGIVPTPTVQVMVEELNADGGIVISASHNPIQWNAFKLITEKGTFLNSRQVKKFFSFMEEEGKFQKYNGIGNLIQNNDAEDIHINQVLKVINSKGIIKKKYTVVLDSVNGAGSIITPHMLKKLGCRVIEINCTPDGTFPRGAEPLPDNLTELSRAVLKHKADIGFAQDPDADRLAIVDDKGRPIGEEYTIALVTDHLLSKEKGRVVVNLSTTKAVEDIAKNHGAPFKRSKVGEINVVEEMIKNGARIGGEGNGGVISPELHLGRDSLAGIGYILDMMVKRNSSISEIVSQLPQYVMIKGKIGYNPDTFNEATVDSIKNSNKGESISTIDGLRIDFKSNTEFKGGWVHLRPSNTEPIFRIITEGRDSKQAQAIYKHFVSYFK